MARGRDRRRQILAKLPLLAELIRGSVVVRWLRCGKPGCDCAEDEGHRATDPSVTHAGRRTREASFEVFARSQGPQWIEQALATTGSATVRRRELPAEQVVWAVIGMGPFRHRSTREVVHPLGLGLPGKTPAPGPAAATSSAVVQARNRLGAESQFACRRRSLAGEGIACRLEEHPFFSSSLVQGHAPDHDPLTGSNSRRHWVFEGRCRSPLEDGGTPTPVPEAGR